MQYNRRLFGLSTGRIVTTMAFLAQTNIVFLVSAVVAVLISPFKIFFSMAKNTFSWCSVSVSEHLMDVFVISELFFKARVVPSFIERFITISASCSTITTQSRAAVAAFWKTSFPPITFLASKFFRMVFPSALFRTELSFKIHLFRNWFRSCFRIIRPRYLTLTSLAIQQSKGMYKLFHI